MPSSKDKFRKRENYAVHGHSLSKHSTSNHNSCFLKCAQNCQCLSANYKQDNENENFFIFYEMWESYELWQQHMAGAHLAEYVKATEGAVDEFIVNQMSEV